MGRLSPLIILVGVQTVMLTILVFKVVGLEARLADGDAPDQIVEQPTPAISASGSSLTEDEIRKILRSELAALTVAPQPAQAASAPAPAASTAPQRTADTDSVYRDFESDLSRLIAKGSANDAEIAALEMQIASLPLEQRKLALSAISRAVSNGTLDARF